MDDAPTTRSNSVLASVGAQGMKDRYRGWSVEMQAGASSWVNSASAASPPRPLAVIVEPATSSSSAGVRGPSSGTGALRSPRWGEPGAFGTRGQGGSAGKDQPLADVDAVRVAVQARGVLREQRLPAAAQVLARGDLAQRVAGAHAVRAAAARGHGRLARGGLLLDRLAGLGAAHAGAAGSVGAGEAELARAGGPGAPAL